MKTSDFDFPLPERLIATRPATPRDSARMLVVGQGPFQDDTVKNLPGFLRPGDMLVFNDTRVLPARLYGKRGEASIELLLHKELAQDSWQAFARPAKRLRVNDTVTFSATFSATVAKKLESGEVVLHFHPPTNIREQLHTHGHMPLPPYIERQRPADAQDRTDYQTLFAREEGSVAAPTAGLHFTESLLQALAAKGVLTERITLHVGPGTFLPVKTEDPSAHTMHSEYALVTPEAAANINAAKRAGGRIIPVGTTSLRTLESATDNQGILHPYAQETNIFITPGYRFKLTDALLTNFHLPRSTLFMLTAALSGLETMQTAYAHAIAHDYRFYSYGDACLLFPTTNRHPPSANR